MQSDNEDPPALPPPTPPPERSKLKQTLQTLRSPFKSGSPFHIGSVKRTGSTKSSDAEGTSKVMPKIRKKNKKAKTEPVPTAAPSSAAPGADAPGGSTVGDASESPRKAGKEAKKAGAGGAAGALVRKLSGMRRGRRGRSEGETQSSGGESPAPPANRASPTPEPPLARPDDDIDSHSSSIRDMEEPPADRTPSPPPSTASSQEQSEPPVATVSSGGPGAVIATDHPVSTLPFTKSAWKRHSDPEMPRPVEAPSPDNVLRRRIAFVAQASIYMSDDGEEEEGEGGGAGSLEQAVELARVRLGRAAGSHTPPAARNTRTDTLEPQTESEEEEAGRAEAMPAYGDLFTPQDKPQDMGRSHSSSHTTAPGSERREHLYKILVIGELGTGKTSIIKRYVHQFFSQHYRATIGVDFALKVLNWDANTVIRLQLWDIAGQERFGNMTRVYYKEAVGAFIVFDVTRVATFDAVLKWKMDLDSKVQLPDGSPIPCILLANKCDQQKEGIINTPAKMEEYCREKGFAGWFETSAKENVNIEEAARSLVNKILLNDKLLQSSDSKDSDRIALDHRIANGENSRDGSSKKCSC